MADGGDIIIKGGSVEVNFDNNLYRAIHRSNKHRKDSRKITEFSWRIRTARSSFDSGADPSGLRWIITVSSS